MEDDPLPGRKWFLYALWAVLGVVVFSNNAHAAVSEDEIAGFLYKINDAVRQKVATLSGNVVYDLPAPVLLGVSPGDFSDTWGEPRAGGRAHTGTDIIAPKGAFIVSPTEAVVTKIGYDDRGGNFVITANPGGEQYYYAHLDSSAAHLVEGDELKKGDLIGYVGATGNARGKTPHLHFGIYYKNEPINPFPRLRHAFTGEERVAALTRIMETAPIVFGAEHAGVRVLQILLIMYSSGAYADVLREAGATGYFGEITRNALAEYQQTERIYPAEGVFGPLTSASMAQLLESAFLEINQSADFFLADEKDSEMPYELLARSGIDLDFGARGPQVERLQRFLISADSGTHASALAAASATGYFGEITQNALAEYQELVGIEPASGYFGPITRSWLSRLAGF